MPTPTIEENVRLLKAHNKQVMIKVVLYDNDNRIVDDITGRIVSVSYEVSAESDIRRTCSLTINVDSKGDLETDFESTWNNRIVELNVGILDERAGEYVWYALGRMLMTSGNTSYSAITQEYKLNLVDCMATLMQERGSQMGTKMVIYAGANISDAIEAIVNLYSPYTRTDIVEIGETIPYDIEVDIGSYPHEALKLLLNLYPYYEMFFDKEGTFVVRKIPTKTYEPIDVDADILDDVIISENKTVNFSSIKNSTEIWGRSLESTYVATECELTGHRYDVTIDDTFEKLVVGESYTVTPDASSVSNQTMKIQDTAEYQIYTVSGDGQTFTPIPAGTMKANMAYSVQYIEGKFILLGQLVIHVIVVEVNEEPTDEQKIRYKNANACNDVKWIVNPDNPYACRFKNDYIDGEYRQVFRDGDYGNINTTQLAYERATYENWIKCRLQDTVDTKMLIVPWMDVNDKIRYTSPVNGRQNTWLVQSLSYNFSDWTMTVKCARFYSYYPFDDEPVTAIVGSAIVDRDIVG